MLERLRRLFYKQSSSPESGPISSDIPDAVPGFIEKYDDDKPAVVVCEPPPYLEFDPVLRQRDIGILRYTARKRFRILVLIAIGIVFLVVGLFLFLFLRNPTSSTTSTSSVTTTTLQGFTSTTTDFTRTTTNYNPPCSPENITTFLFAYSNDFDSQTVLNVWNHFADSRLESVYSTFANIRFDIRNEDEIQYNKDWRKVNNSILSHLPNSSLTFNDPTTESDVFKMMKKFMANTQAPICGSQMYILVKRYSSETEIEELVENLRANQASFTFMTSTYQTVGGNHPETLYNLATQTHGFCGFDDDINKAIGSLPGGFYPYLVYAANPQVSRQGTIDLAPLTVSNEGDYWFSMTVQDHGPIDYSAKVNLTWTNSDAGKTGSLGVPDNSPGWSGNHLGFWESLDKLVYRMTLNYEYTYDKVQTLQIRIYSKEPIDYWAAYDN